MKITLINPPASHVESLYVVGMKAPPLGLAYLASTLERSGHEVEIIDASALELSISQIKSVLEKDQPEIIGVTATTPTIYNAFKIVKAAKEVCPGSFTVLGGSHPSFQPTETLKECPYLDAVCVGEGEETIVELAEALKGNKCLSDVKGIAYKSKGNVMKNPPRPFIENLDSLPFPAWHLLPMGNYTLFGKKTVICHMMSSRGCPFQCIFCSSSLFFGKKYRARTAKNVVDEMECLISKYNPESIEFSDDEFTLNGKRVEDICSEIKRRGLDVWWACSSRVDTISTSLLKKMRAAGCFLIYFGIESGSQRILNYIKKGISIEQVRKAVRWTREAGIKTLGSFIIGFPDETKEEIEKTVRFSKELKLDYAQFSIATPYPGTELYEMAKRKRLLFTEDWSRYTAAKPVMAMKNLNIEELLRIFKKAYIRFYLSPAILLRNLNRNTFKVLNLTVKSAFKSLFHLEGDLPNISCGRNINAP
jgi:radical SAM superfamily enzyme YgiQ (UPF0313 family)